MKQRSLRGTAAAGRGDVICACALIAILALPGCASLRFPEEPLAAPQDAPVPPPLPGVPDDDSWAALSRAGRDALRLGHYALAEESFRDALASTAGRPARDARVQASLGNLLRLAAQYQKLQRHEDAGRVLAEVIREARDGRPPTLELLEPVLLAQTRWLRTTGRPDEAIALYDAALALPETQGPSAARTRIALQQQRGNALLRAGRPDEAATALEQARSELEAREGPVSLRVAAVLVDLARARQALSDLEAAEVALTRALSIQERTAPESVSLAITANTLAWLYLQAGRNAEASALARRAITILNAQKARGALRAASLETLAEAELALGDAAEAERHFRAAIQARDEESDPAARRELLGILERYAALLRDTGRGSEARAIEARIADESR